MPYRYLVWDFDGTLADTLPVALEIFNSLAPKHGFRPIDDVASMRGLDTAAFLRSRGIPLWKLPGFVREFLAVQRSHMPRIRVFPEVLEVLGQLRASGGRSGIVSANRTDNIRDCLQANRAEAFFEFVIGYLRLFGKSRAIRRAMRDAGVDPEEVLYAGDEVRDIEAARKTGIAIAAVTWGFHTRELLAEHEPTYLVDDPRELLALVGGDKRGLANEHGE